MSDNKLMEAAAEILSGSKSGAPAMPPETIPAEIVDLGGPTPQNGKPTDDSEKIDATKAATKAEPPKTKPSNASVNKEDVDQIFGDANLSEDFKEKAALIFETRLQDKISQIKEELETEYASKLEEAVSEIQEDLSSKIDDYLSYVVEQWMEQNALAIESGLRTELSEEFIVGLKNLFAEHYIDIPEEKVNLIDELTEKVVDLESKLNEEIEKSVSYRKELIEAKKSEITHEICDGLTATQVEKIKSLAEGVEFSTEDEYKSKLETIRENYFPTGVKKADASQLHESVEVKDVPVITDAFVAAVSEAISKTKHM